MRSVPNTVELGNILKSRLRRWAEIDPDLCRQVTPLKTVPDFFYFQVFLKGLSYNLACESPWVPSEIELAVIDRAVAQAVEQRGWVSMTALIADWTTHEDVQNQKLYRSSVYVYMHDRPIRSVVAEASEPASARLFAYLKADQEFAS